jgi:PAS domain S-box-containing protein
MAIGATLENRWEDVQHLKRAFNCFPDHMLIINPYTLKIIDANQTAQKLLGYSKEELLNLSLSQIDAAYNIESISSAFDAIIKSKEQHANFPTIHRRKDGSTFSVEVYLRCFTENGQPYILALATDTSVLKKVQDELNFHSILLNNITDAIVSTDQNFIVTSWNKYAEEIFGWSAQEAIGRSATSLTAAIYPNSTLEEVGALLFKNGFWKGEIITRKKSGTTFSALISIGVLKDDAGTVAGTVSVLKDISERKKKDEQIKHLAELVNKVSDAIISVDKNYDIVTWNSGATMIYGYEENEVMGKSIFNLWMRSNLYW